MRTLLRNIPTGQYFQSLEHWTSNPDEAYDFKFLSRAMRFVTKCGFKEMELILSFDQGSASNGAAQTHGGWLSPGRHVKRHSVSLFPA